jgi:hypothetical protein
MRYWWVNQNQTYRHEVQGGYLWSPKRNANGARNPFYESMREVAPGDLIFSFMDTRILAIGIAQSYCWESPKPLESMLSKKSFLAGELNFSAPQAHPTCADVRGHIESQESDHRASYMSYRGLQQRRQLKTERNNWDRGRVVLGKD